MVNAWRNKPIVVSTLLAIVIGAGAVYVLDIPQKIAEFLGEKTPVASSPSSSSPMVKELSGWVASINAEGNSFEMTSRKGDTFQVILGKETTLELHRLSIGMPKQHKSLVYSPGFSSPQEQVTTVQLQELEVGDQINIIASAPIVAGQAIENPIKVEIFRKQ